MKTVLLIISGGVSAYKSVDIARALIKEGVRVVPVMTENAQRFVTSLLLQAATGVEPLTSLWQGVDTDGMDHIHAVRRADLILIAPATANLLAKSAHGFADDIASSMILSATCPIFFAPAMNSSMYLNQATQDNIATLKRRNARFIEPHAGLLACGENGIGRLAPLEEITQTILTALNSADTKGALAGLKTVVTAGPTYENIDPVRFIGNRSSGKQGYAIASALRDAGADVTLISGPVHLAPLQGVKTIKTVSAREMMSAVNESMPCDIFVGCAAVGDWRVKNAQSDKIKKDAVSSLTLEMELNPDILKTISHAPNRPRLVVGFCAETIGMENEAVRKRTAKGCDWMLGNDVKKFPFGGDRNEIHFVTENANETWRNQTKTDIAQRLTAKIVSKFAP